MSAFEKTLQREVIKYLREKGCVVYNIHGSEHQSGVPDIIACVCGRFVALELKTPAGKLSALQQANLRMVQRSGGVAEEVRSLGRVKEIIEQIENE